MGLLDRLCGRKGRFADAAARQAGRNNSTHHRFVMNCPHCNENIAVRLEKPGKKAARRRQLRARKAQRMAELRSPTPSDEEE
jgi:hypothetical protein